MKRAVNLILFSAVLLFTNCATVFTGTKETVMINSEPPGAKIYVDGFERGVTPAALRLKKSNDGQIIMLKAKGYEPFTFQPETDFNPVSILNLANLLFWGIDFASGAFWKYNQKAYTLELTPKQTAHQGE